MTYANSTAMQRLAGFAVLALAAAALLLSGTPVHAAYPSKPVTLIIPYKAGGSTETMARVYSKALQKELGQPVIVKTRPGGGGAVGATVVAKSKPDGYTMLFAAASALVWPPMTQKVEYDLKSFRWVASITEYQQALKAAEGADSVFHLAARVGSLEYLHSSEVAELVALQTNLLVDANIFRACLEHKVKKLVYASSCAVYPMKLQYRPGAVLSENDLRLDSGHGTIDPDGGYGWSKFMGEIQLGWMQNIDIGIARIFNIYGENEPVGEGKAHLVGDLIRKVILNPQSALRIRGNGNQTLDFLYVSDCADALIRLEEKASNPPAITNIGSGNAVSIRTIAEKVAELPVNDIEIIYDADKTAGPTSRSADMTKTRTLLDWQPKISLDEGIRHTYSWIQRKLQGNVS